MPRARPYIPTPTHIPRVSTLHFDHTGSLLAGSTTGRGLVRQEARVGPCPKGGGGRLGLGPLGRIPTSGWGGLGPLGRKQKRGWGGLGPLGKIARPRWDGAGWKVGVSPEGNPISKRRRRGLSARMVSDPLQCDGAGCPDVKVTFAVAGRAGAVLAAYNCPALCAMMREAACSSSAALVASYSRARLGCM